MFHLVLPVRAAPWLLAYSLSHVSDVAGWSVTSHLQTLVGEEVLNVPLLMRAVLVAPLRSIHHPCQVLSDQPLVTAVMGYSPVMQPHACSLRCQVIQALRGL